MREKTREQLLEELDILRKEIADLKSLDIDHREAEFEGINEEESEYL